MLTPKRFEDFGISIPSGRAGEIDTQCPQCSPTRKKKQARCLSVNVDKGVWLCNHCGWSGGLSIGEQRVDIGWNKPKFRRPSQPEAKPRDAVEDWFAERGIPASALERNRITASVVYMPQVEDHVKAIAFPYYRGEELINVKYRDREKNFRMEAGAERVLYGLNDIEAEMCVICEGEVDKLSIEVAGFTSCVSVPDGAPTPTTKDYSSKFSFLESDAETLSAVRTWILAVDNDEPGKRLEDELARRLGREKCRRAIWTSECKDANDVLRSHGASVLRECLVNAEPFPVNGVFTHEEMAPQVRNLFVNGWEKAVHPGWDELARFYNVRPGELTVITGVPSAGKSNVLDALSMNVARSHGWRFMVFSPENQPVSDHIARMCEKYLQMPFFDGPTQRMSEAQMSDAMAWVMERFFWYLPKDESEWTVENVLQTAKQLVYSKGIQGLIIDPWNELECARPRDMTETEYIGLSLRRIRQFARTHGVHIWVVTHPPKLDKQKDGSYPVPTLYDCAGSAHWRNKADNGLCVWRDYTDDRAPIEVHVQKIRFRQNGKLGVAKFDYQPVTATYKELAFFDPRNR